ncbi:ABC transporter ATP-binding protein, partial [Streptomyces sp. SID3343]|nr:ABC transporter ATP-binding protein [Streptomyces sp. SID3343]
MNSAPAEGVSGPDAEPGHRNDGFAPTGPSPLLPVAGAAQTRRAAYRLMRPHRRSAVAAGALLAASTAVGLATPLVLGRMVDA